MKKVKETSIKKILMLGLILCLFCVLQLSTYAVFNPESIPEEEQSAVAAEYYDEEDKKINEQVSLIKRLDKARQKDSDTYNHFSELRNLLNTNLNKAVLPQPKSSYANYNRENATAYALNYAESHN